MASVSWVDNLMSVTGLMMIFTVMENLTSEMLNFYWTDQLARTLDMLCTLQGAENQ